MQWTNWSRRLLGQLCGPKAAVLPVSDLRMLLEEACLSSVGSHSLTSKLALLRDEKKLLTNPRVNLRSIFPSGKSRKNIVSIRSIIVTFLTLRRIQRMSGFLPIHYGSQNEPPEHQSRHFDPFQRSLLGSRIPWMVARYLSRIPCPANQTFGLFGNISSEARDPPTIIKIGADLSSRSSTAACLLRQSFTHCGTPALPSTRPFRKVTKSRLSLNRSF
jgi:hypothetical protein